MTTVTHNEAGNELAHKALRFLTAGSVDDGKSTLIGRLLFDSRAILGSHCPWQRQGRRRSADLPVW